MNKDSAKLGDRDGKKRNRIAKENKQEESEPFASQPKRTQPLSNLHSLDSCITALISDATGSSSPFYCTIGMIGLTYGEIKVGDVICLFRESATVVALRCVNGTYEVNSIGWISFNRVGRDAKGRDRSQGSGLHDDSTIDLPVHFLFSMQGLMLVAAHRS